MAGANRLIELDGPSWQAFRRGVASLDAEAKKELRAVTKRKAEQIAKVAAEEAPERTGRLKRSVRGVGTNLGGQVRVGSASLPYAPPIHWGWPSRGIRPQRFIVWGLARVSKESNGGFEQEYIDEILSLFEKHLPGSRTRG